MQPGHALSITSPIPIVLASFSKQSVSIQRASWELSHVQATSQNNLRNHFGSLLAAVGQNGT